MARGPKKGTGPGKVTTGRRGRRGRSWFGFGSGSDGSASNPTEILGKPIRNPEILLEVNNLRDQMSLVGSRNKPILLQPVDNNSITRLINKTLSEVDRNRTTTKIELSTISNSNQTPTLNNLRSQIDMVKTAARNDARNMQSNMQLMQTRTNTKISVASSVLTREFNKQFKAYNDKYAAQFKKDTADRTRLASQLDQKKQQYETTRIEQKFKLNAIAKQAQQREQEEKSKPGGFLDGILGGALSNLLLNSPKVLAALAAATAAYWLTDPKNRKKIANAINPFASKDPKEIAKNKKAEKLLKIDKQDEQLAEMRRDLAKRIAKKTREAEEIENNFGLDATVRKRAIERERIRIEKEKKSKEVLERLDQSKNKLQEELKKRQAEKDAANAKAAKEFQDKKDAIYKKPVGGLSGAFGKGPTRITVDKALRKKPYTVPPVNQVKSYTQTHKVRKVVRSLTGSEKPEDIRTLEQLLDIPEIPEGPPLPGQRPGAPIPSRFPISIQRMNETTFQRGNAPQAHNYAQYKERANFMKFGALPEGFEFAPGHRGLLGSPGAVSARGAMPFGGGQVGQGGYGSTGGSTGYAPSVGGSGYAPALRSGGGGQDASTDTTSAYTGTPGTPKYDGKGHPVLAQQREQFFAEMDRDPRLKGLVQGLIMKENHSHPEGPLEAMMNRIQKRRAQGGKFKNWGVRKELYSGFYGPMNRGEIGPINSKKALKAIDRVRAGSNDIGLRDDQGMIGEHKFADKQYRRTGKNIARKAKIKGEWYSDQGFNSIRQAKKTGAEMAAYDKANPNWREGKAAPKLKETKVSPMKLGGPAAPPSTNLFKEHLDQSAIGTGEAPPNFKAPAASDSLDKLRPRSREEEEQAAGWKAFHAKTEGVVNQNQKGSVRRYPLSKKLLGVLKSAASSSGVEVDVWSGGQDAAGRRKLQSSPRHDHGNAADLDLYVRDGKTRRKLRSSNKADRKLISKFIQESARRGATGIGTGQKYMGDGRLHVGYGGTNRWGGGMVGDYRKAWSKGVEQYRTGQLPDDTVSEDGEPVIKTTGESSYDEAPKLQEQFSGVERKLPDGTVKSTSLEDVAPPDPNAASAGVAPGTATYEAPSEKVDVSEAPTDEGKDSVSYKEKKEAVGGPKGGTNDRSRGSNFESRAPQPGSQGTGSFGRCFV